jgi:hypothetical protein
MHAFNFLIKYKQIIVKLTKEKKYSTSKNKFHNKEILLMK